MKKILIAGDSFSSLALSGEHGWPYLLNQQHYVTNISSPGIGEYKIMRAIERENLSKYDVIIVNHTSPNRVHCTENLLYPAKHVYRNSDLIFADAESKLPSPDAELAYNYFLKIFDADYYRFIHESCCKRIDQLTKGMPVIHMTHFEWSDLYEFNSMLNFYNLWLNNTGTYNHYNQSANQIILKAVQDRL